MSTHISEPDKNGHVTVATDQHRIVVMPRRDHEYRACALHVDVAMARSRDAELDRLASEEADLPDGQRWCTRVENGGSHPEVDALYDAMNNRLMAVHVEIAQEALQHLGDVVTGDLDTAVSDAYFSRNAGCADCPCTPGVVLPGDLHLNGRMVDIEVLPVS